MGVSGARGATKLVLELRLRCFHLSSPARWLAQPQPPICSARPSPHHQRALEPEVLLAPSVCESPMPKNCTSQTSVQGTLSLSTSLCHAMCGKWLRSPTSARVFHLIHANTSQSSCILSDGCPCSSCISVVTSVPCACSSCANLCGCWAKMVCVVVGSGLAGPLPASTASWTSARRPGDGKQQAWASNPGGRQAGQAAEMRMLDFASWELVLLELCDPKSILLPSSAGRERGELLPCSRVGPRKIILFCSRCGRSSATFSLVYTWEGCVPWHDDRYMITIPREPRLDPWGQKQRQQQYS